MGTHAYFEQIGMQTMLSKIESLELVQERTVFAPLQHILPPRALYEFYLESMIAEDSARSRARLHRDAADVARRRPAPRV